MALLPGDAILKGMQKYLNEPYFNFSRLFR